MTIRERYDNARLNCQLARTNVLEYGKGFKLSFKDCFNCASFNHQLDFMTWATTLIALRDEALQTGVALIDENGELVWSENDVRIEAYRVRRAQRG